MSVDVEKMFANMATAEVHGKGTFMGDGIYEVKTKNLFVKKGMNPAKPGDSFICEFEILKSTNEAHKIGSTGSYVLKFSNPYTMGNIVELVTALLGYDNTKANQENSTIREQGSLVTRATCGSEESQKELAALRAGLEDPTFGKLTDVTLKLECKKVPTKTPGGEFTTHKWAPLTAKVAP